MTTQAETPWMPGPDDLPWTFSLLNMTDWDRHLSFNDKEGRWYRLWQHRQPEPLTADAAMMLRPSDVNLIIRHAMWWATEHPDSPQANALIDQCAAGAKALVVHFAKMAGAY